MRSVKFILVPVVILVVLMFGSVLFLERVPPSKIGVKQQQWGGSGLVEQDFETGFHVGISGIHKWYMLDKRTHFLTFSDTQSSSRRRGSSSFGTRERSTQGSLTIRTRDLNTVHVDVTVTYVIKPGEAHLLVKSGLRDIYPDRVMSTVESVLLRQLAQLSSEDFYSTETRVARAQETLPDLKAALAGFHVVPSSILIRAVRFPDRYEEQLQEKQLTRQKTKLATAREKVEVRLQATGKSEKEIEAAEKEQRGTWDKRLQEKRSENQVQLAEILGEANKTNQEVRANADADYETMVADGKLAVDKAEALRYSLRNAALNTAGGRIFMARQAAENLNIESVTLNSNDPNVPTIIDIPAMVKLLIGSDD